MNLLFELLLDILQAVIPWGSRHEDRSVVGEAPIDRKARFWRHVLVGVLVAVLLSLGFWLWWR